MFIEAEWVRYFSSAQVISRAVGAGTPNTMPVYGTAGYVCVAKRVCGITITTYNIMKLVLPSMNFPFA